jgi:RNA 2',3'-cyclic 3'-phosphodiesterase
VRCFVALDLPAPVRIHLAEITRPLRGKYDVKWVDADQLHLTLLFGGELDDDAAGELVRIVEEAPLPPLSLRLQQLGHFPPRGLPRVLWAGLGGDTDAVTELHRGIDTLARPLGIEREKRGFTPHITLGRIRSDFGALALVDELRKLGDQLKPKPFTPTELVLYRSVLKPSGAVHSSLVRRVVPKPVGAE